MNDHYPGRGPPHLARKAVLAGIRAAAMGLISPGEAFEQDGPDALRAILERVQSAGIARGLVKEPAAVYEMDEIARLLDELDEAMIASPVPDTEWPAVERVLGAEPLATLLGISVSSLRRYASGTRSTPDDVAARLHFLALVIGDLAGSYNEIGIRRWFTRRRTQLDGRAPVDLLNGGWDPDDAGPSRVRALAGSLLGSSAT